MLNPLEEQLIRHYQFDSDLDVNIYEFRKNIQKIKVLLMEKYHWFDELDQFRQEVLINLSFFVGVDNLTTEFNSMMFALKNKNWKVSADFLVNSHWGRKAGGRAIELAKQLHTGERQ